MKQEPIKILCIIPARAGSKRLPNKNVKPIFGKPLIAWTAEQAMKCSHFTKVIVSTDSPEIAKVASDFGVEVPFLRPEELSMDSSPSFDFVQHALNFYKEKSIDFDVVALLEPTSPLRMHNDLHNAISLFLEKYNEYDALISVGKLEREHPVAIKKLINSSLVTPYIEDCQDHEAYFPYGVIYAAKIEKYLHSKTFYQERSLPYVIQRWQNFEIDDMVDFTCVEKMMEVYQNEL